jgi:hypothetical protein
MSIATSTINPAEAEKRIRIMISEMAVAYFGNGEGWSATFETELAALRVANYYSTPRSVKFLEHNKLWRVAIK